MNENKITVKLLKSEPSNPYETNEGTIVSSYDDVYNIFNDKKHGLYIWVLYIRDDGHRAMYSVYAWYRDKATINNYEYEWVESQKQNSRNLWDIIQSDLIDISRNANSKDLKWYRHNDTGIFLPCLR